MWKLRTMIDNCERESGVVWSTPGDHRVTRIGRFLRHTHIDEFPQLLNVLRGEMSLVGPRPERPEFYGLLSVAVPDYSRRLAIKPGVTGLAQVVLPPDVELDDVRRKQVYDLYYLRHVNVGFDLRLVLATALRAIGVPFRVVRPLLSMPSPTTVGAMSADRRCEAENCFTIASRTSPQPVSQIAT
jgi:lipopolysaccharide/colanic/teichoic acid biosynthesis glycosyltransferase